MDNTLKQLAQLVQSIAQNNGITPTQLANVEIFRFDSPNIPPLYSVYPISLTLTVSGSKQIFCGEQILHYGAGFSVMVAIDMPITAQITQATEHEPYLCVHIALDWMQLSRLAQHTAMKRDDLSKIYALSVVETESSIVNTIYRLLKLQDDDLKDFLEPLVREELAIRLLHGKHGANIQCLLAKDSPERKISQAVTFLKQRFAEKINMDGLAASVNMSATAFRQHFRAVTGFSPLQYQKQLRLQQAHLLLSQGIGVAQTAMVVGYESASQFSREYSRSFGETPNKTRK